MFKREVTLPKSSLYDKTDEWLQKFFATFSNILQFGEEYLDYGEMYAQNQPNPFLSSGEETFEKTRVIQKQHCKKMYGEITNARVSINNLKQYWSEGRPIMDKMDECMNYIEKQTDIILELDQLLDNGDPFEKQMTKKREILFTLNRDVSLQADIAMREWLAMLQKVWV